MSSTLFKPCIVIIVFLLSHYSKAQSYAKDSLQIKVYTEIEYKNNNAVNIKLSKVFCDYCSDFQKKEMGNEGLRRANLEKNLPENKLQNGIKKLAMYIRIAKKDFAKLKTDE